MYCLKRAMFRYTIIMRIMVTQWSHVTWLRFWQDALSVDGRQVVSMVSVRDRVSLFGVNGLLRISVLLSTVCSMMDVT